MGDVAARTQTARVRIQKIGRFLSGMVMPNLGAFIAWGLITAMFIPSGWIPNEKLAAMVDPMIIYLLPLLIGFTGGRMVWGIRGGVVGAVTTIGIIIGTEIPMFLGAMLMGPLGGWVIKKFDELLEGKVPVGFEMLVANLSAGAVGAVLSASAFLVAQPVVTGLMRFLGGGVEWVVEHNLLPMASLFIEPGKILFLNNAINHGILAPLGAAQVQEMGKSILFLLETNPGPGLGILLTYWLFSKGTARASAPGAVVIHFLGGIHEIYFPYVLMQPILVIAVIAGGASGVLTFMTLGAGEMATPSPGSIFALMAVAPKGGHLSILLGIIASSAVSFVVAIPFVRGAAARASDEDLTHDLESARATSRSLRHPRRVTTIAFACDAGMGTSAMGANRLQKMLRESGFDGVTVVHCSVDDVPRDADVVICHKTLVDRVAACCPGARCYGISNFVSADEYRSIIDQMAVRTVTSDS